MNETRLRLQHLYDNPISIAPYHSSTVSYHHANKPTSQNLKIQTKHINLEPDYDLPLKQLQYTKTRKYKQNLNPIFQQLQTTQDRYAYSKQWQKEKKYDKGNRNDDFPVSDRYFMKQARKEENKRLNELKERSRVLSQNVKKVKKGEVVQERVKRIEPIVPQKDNNFKIQQILPLDSHSQQLTSQQRSSAFIQQLLQKVSDTQSSIQQTDQKLDLLTKQLHMHKEKSLIKQRQLFYLQQEKETVVMKGKELEEMLKGWAVKYAESENQYNEASKRLRVKKKELKKEQGWLREENEEIRRIDMKIGELLKLMREAEEENERREDLMRQLQEETEIKQQLTHNLQQLQAHTQSLTHQFTLLQQQTTTLDQHLQQLQSLQQKFHLQTESLLTTIQQLNQQIAAKHEFIEQEQQIDQLIKQVELEMGQISQKKIVVEQEIQEVNVKISLKKRNIRYIRDKQPEAREFGKNVGVRENTYENDYKHYRNSQVSFTELNNSQHNPYAKKPSIQLSKPLHTNPLPTIRQQSNNTSAYQSPRPQYPEPYHQFQSLQLDSRMVSQTQILKPHQSQSPTKLKKYFVIQSEDDGVSNGRSSFYFGQGNSGVRQQQRVKERRNSKGDGIELRSEEVFVERQKKPSIEHRLYEMEGSVLRTEHDQNNRKSLSLQLQSPNNHNLANYLANRRQSQQSQYFPHPQPPKPKSRQKPSQKQQSSATKNRPSHISSKIESISPRSMTSNMQEEVIESLIEQYQQIRSNSYFEEAWKEKI